MKKLKQGQTVYLVTGGYEFNPPKPHIIKWFLYSSKQPLPDEGCIIDKMPVSHANAIEHMTKLHTSRRKAAAELNNLKRVHSWLNI